MGIWRVFVSSFRYIQSFWRHPTETQPATRSTFNSSFIQSWYCQNWDLNRWLQEYRMLRKVGIGEIIIPYVQRFVAFSIDHYQNGNESSLVTGYDEYERYYLNQDEERSS